MQNHYDFIYDAIQMWTIFALQDLYFSQESLGIILKYLTTIKVIA